MPSSSGIVGVVVVKNSEPAVLLNSEIRGGIVALYSNKLSVVACSRGVVRFCGRNSVAAIVGSVVKGFWLTWMLVLVLVPMMMRSVV